MSLCTKEWESKGGRDGGSEDATFSESNLFLILPPPPPPKHDWKAKPLGGNSLSTRLSFLEWQTSWQQYSNDYWQWHDWNVVWSLNFKVCCNIHLDAFEFKLPLLYWSTVNLPLLPRENTATIPSASYFMILQ